MQLTTKKATKVRIPRNRIISSKKNKTSRSKRKKPETKSVVRGKEVSISESSSERQIIYGRMKVGGVITFVSTNSSSHAYLLTGSGNSQISWTARAGGEGGNLITVTIIKPTNNATLTIGVVGNDITVTVRSSAGSSLSTAQQVINAIRANGAANTLVSVGKADGDATAHVGAEDQASLQNGGGTWLHTVHTLAGHQIDAIETLYLDKRAVTFGNTPDPRWGTGIWNNKVFMAFFNGATDQEAQPDLMGQLPLLWTEDHRQRGCAGVYMINVYSQNLYTEGFPESSFLVRGKPVYDPRTDTTVWSNNSALIVADFLCDPTFGFGLSYAENIDEDALIVAADICDEAVAIAAGGTEPRYTTNGCCDFGDPDEILSQLLDAMDGEIVESGEIYRIYAGAYRTPTIHFTQDDLRGPIQVTTHVSRSDRFNCVRATYVDPLSDYKETDAPPVKNSTYVAEDGAELYQDLALNWVTSAGQCQRLMKIELEKVRQGQTLVLPLKASGLLAEGLDNVFFTFEEYGFSDKIYQAREIDHVIEQDGSVGFDFILRETASGIWDWNSGEETTVDLAPDSNLPSASDVAEPTDVTLTSGTSELYIRQDGAVFSRLKVSWTPSSTEFVTNGGEYHIQYKKTADSDWSIAITIPGFMSFYHILDVQDGVSYDVRIQAVNTLNYASDWVEVDGHTVIGKTEPPSDVTGLTATINSFGIVISCDPITDLDADLYEFRYTTSAQAWADATQVATPARSTTINWKYQPAGDYTLMVKAIDTSGNPSDTEDTFSLTVPAPTAPTVSVVIDGENAIISWTASSSVFGVKEYEIRYGASYVAGTTLAVITGLRYQTPVTWGGTRDFFVVARDIAGNDSSVGTASLTIISPDPVTGFRPKVLGNNVLLDWDEPVITSLPIHHYQVFKGDVFATAELLGTVYGTFHTYVERRGGLFRYWVVVYDTAGNASTTTDDSVTVTEPDDFFIRDDSDIVGNLIDSRHALLGGSNPLPDGDEDSYYLPIASTEEETMGPLVPFPSHETWKTWEDFFVDHGFTTMQDAIDAGYLMFGMPSTDEPGYLLFKFDYGLVFSSSFIQLSWEEEVLNGHVTFTPTVSYSEDDVSYTDEVGADQVFAEDFRYVKYRIDFEGDDDKALYRIFNIRARLSLKIEEEYGPVDVFAADVNIDPDLDGTFVPFEKAFLDVRDIQITILNGQPGDQFVLNFQDVPNPTGFRVLLFDIDGIRIDGTINRRVIGAVNPE